MFDLRNALYLKLQSLSFAYYDTARTGDLMARLVGDVAVFRQFVSFGFANLLSSLLMIIFGFSMMSSINWRLSLLALATTPFLAVAAFRFRSVVHPAFSRLRRLCRYEHGGTRKHHRCTNRQEFCPGTPSDRDFSKRADNVVDRHMQTVAIWKKFFPTMDLIGNMSMLLLLYVGGREVILERMSMGDLVASFSLIWYIVSPVQQLGYQINSFTQAVAAGERLVEILGAPETVRNSLTPAPGSHRRTCAI